MSGAPILRLRGITKSFGKVEVLRGVDLDVHVGVRHLLIGPNGAGKTTLFNVINGHFPPTAGSIEFDGGDITRLPVARRARSGLGRTFQVASLFPHLTVWENLLIAAQAPSLLRKGSLLETAMALATAPRMLLLDEPMAGLTQEERGAFADRVIELSVRTAILLIEHDLEVALRIAERVTVLNLGTVVYDGKPADVLAAPIVQQIYLG